MEIIEAARANDGTLFETEEACIAYESRFYPGNLAYHIAEHINYSEGDEYNNIEESDVQNYIEEYWEDLKKIMATKPETVIEPTNYSRILPPLRPDTEIAQEWAKIHIL